MKDSNIFYSLTVEDIQTVAEESLERRLSFEEIQKVLSIVETKIPWFDLVDTAIRQVVREEYAYGET